MGNLDGFNDDPIRPGMGSALPAGEYTVQVIAIDFAAPKKDPKGKMLNVRYRVLGGEYQGRMIFDHVVLTYVSNPIAEHLGRARLKTLAHAAIGRDAKDTSELLHSYLSVVVSVKNDPGHRAMNSVNDYRPIDMEILREIRRKAMPGIDEERAATRSAPDDDEPDPTDAIAPVAPSDAAEATEPLEDEQPPTDAGESK